MKEKVRRTYVESELFIFCMFFSALLDQQSLHAGECRKQVRIGTYSKNSPVTDYFHYKKKSVFAKIGFTFRAIRPSSGEAVTIIYRRRQK
jgi:hypothetical protein